MSDYVQAAVTILALINPAICAVIFSSAEHGRDSRNQVGDATKAAAAILIILAVAAVAGASVLSAFGISLDAFQVAGSVVLVWMGFSMLTGSGHSGSPEGASGGAEAPSLLPLVMFAASPGTITGVITVAVTHTGHELPLTALVGAAVAVGVTWLLLLASIRMGGKSGPGHQITASFMGLIVLAMGVQFGLSGLKSFFGVG